MTCYIYKYIYISPVCFALTPESDLLHMPTHTHTHKRRAGQTLTDSSACWESSCARLVHRNESVNVYLSHEQTH